VVVDEAGAPTATTVAQLVESLRTDPICARCFEPPLPARPQARANGAMNGHAALDVKGMSGADILSAIRRGDLPTGTKR
jgi:hypothetical protein